MSTRKERLAEYWEHFWATSAATQQLGSNSDLQAIEFARLLIQSLLILHGGALLAFPTFLQVFNLPIQSRLLLFLGVLACFAIGVALALFAGVFGFFALASRADGNAQELQSQAHHSWAYVADNEGDRLSTPGPGDWKSDTGETASDWEVRANEQRIEAGKASTKAAGIFKTFSWQRKVGIACVLASLALFIVAALLSAYLIATTQAVAS